MAEKLYLKWGTLKECRFETDASHAAFRKYASGGVSLSAMTGEDTPAQKAALCELIDVLQGPIVNDWTGEEMTKDEARRYVMES